jgi:sodium transport system permease protein
MKTAFIIFKKEMMDTLRDRRTLIVMIIIPLLLFPLLMTLSTKIMMKQRKEAQEKTLALAIIPNDNAAGFYKLLKETEGITLKEGLTEDEIQERIKSGKLDFGLVISPDFDKNVAENKQGVVTFYLKSSQETRITGQRIEKLLDQYEAGLIDTRFKELELDINISKAITLKKNDIATVQEKLGEAVGGLLPYIFVIFCFMGTMYPAIDLAAGEKERGTIETLLASPANRMQIVMGKFLVVFLAGISSVAISFFGLFLAVKSTPEIPDALLNLLLQVLNTKTILLVLTLLVPLALFFAAVLLSMSIFAHTFKEAQSIITPLNIVVIVPVFIGLFPGIKLNAATALIPILNVSLATKEIISGTFKTGVLLEVYLSLFLLAAIALIFCAQWFKREDVIFRGS